MKIAITGHTFGLGKAFFDHYVKKGLVVEGFSRKNGYDLRDWTKLQKFLDDTSEFDLIVSNAKPDFVQTVLLYEMSKRIVRARQIINIGSIIVDIPVSQDQDVGINLYKTQKLSLQNAHQQLTEKYPNFNSVLIHPYHLYSGDTVDYNSLGQWIIRMEDAVKKVTQKEIYVK